MDRVSVAQLIFKIMCLSGMIRFKNIFAICTVSIFISLSFLSCCKVDCEGSSIYISFEKYRRAEIDTLTFLGFERNTGFSLLKDSIQYIIPVAQNDTFKATHGHTLFPDKDWLLKIPSLNRQIKFSNYKVEKVRCGCGSGKYDVTKSFFVDGNEIATNFYILPR